MGSQAEAQRLDSYGGVGDKEVLTHLVPKVSLK